MVDFYVMQVKWFGMSIEDVPIDYREKVKNAL